MSFTIILVYSLIIFKEWRYIECKTQMLFYVSVVLEFQTSQERKRDKSDVMWNKIEVTSYNDRREPLGLISRFYI